MRHLNKHNIFVKKAVLISSVVFAVLVFTTVYLVQTWPQRTLNRIERMMANEEYADAENLILEYESAQKKSLKDLSDLCSYNIAIQEMEQGNTESARYRLNDLAGYMDTELLLLECSYIDAYNLMHSQEYEDAYLIYVMLSGYKDSDEMMKEARYQTANKLYDNNDLAKAMEIYLSLGEYKDAPTMSNQAAIAITGAGSIEEANKILEGINLQEMQKIAELTAARNNILFGALAVGANHTIALLSDGSIMAEGSNEYGQCEVNKWSDITYIDAGMYHTVGLKSDGTVVSTGRNIEGQCNVDAWENVVQIAAGAYDTYGLLSDGTIVSTGFSQNETLDTLTNIKYINAGAYAAGCINDEGITFFSHPSLAIHEVGAISVDTATGYSVALMPDGHIVSTLKQTPQFEDVIAVYAGSNMILAIDVEGRVLAHFFDSRDIVDLSDYTNVKAVAAGGSHFALILEDYSIVTFGVLDYNEDSTTE